MKFFKTTVFFLVILMLSSVFAVESVKSGSIQINQLQYDPFPAQSGKYLDLWLTIQNESNGSASSVTCELLPEYHFYLQPDENAVRTIGIMNPDRIATLRYKLIVASDALDSDQKIDFRCRLSNSGAWITQEIDIQVKAVKPEFAIGTITTTPEKLTSDTTNNKISIEIQNIGNESAKLVTTKLVLPNGFTSSKSYSDTYNLGNIGEETSENAIYYLDLDKSVGFGKHPAKLVLNYKYTTNSSDNYKTQEIDFDFDVKAEPKFEIESITISPENLFPGTTAEIKIKLRNIGLEEAEAVSMKVYTQNDQPFDFDKKYDYIGNLDVGESGEVIFTFTTENSAEAKNYLLNSEIRYLVGEEVKLTEEQFNVQIIKKENNDFTIFIIIGVVIVLGVGFYLWKKRK